MRKLFKLLGLLLVAGVLFMSCSNGSNDSKGSGGTGESVTQENAVYKCEMTDDDSVMTSKMTATFKDDGTFSVTSKMGMGSLEMDMGEVMKGTYTGNAATDGTITITITHEMNDDGDLVPYTGSPATMSITITDGKCTFDGMEFVRQ